MRDATQQATNGHVSPAEATTGTAAIVATGVPTSSYSEWLVTNGFGIMSYAEWIQVLGGIWLLILILKNLGIFKLCKWIYSKIRG